MFLLSIIVCYIYAVAAVVTSTTMWYVCIYMLYLYIEHNGVNFDCYGYNSVISSLLLLKTKTYVDWCCRLLLCVIFVFDRIICCILNAIELDGEKLVGSLTYVMYLIFIHHDSQCVYCYSIEVICLSIPAIIFFYFLSLLLTIIQIEATLIKIVNWVIPLCVLLTGH